MFSFYFLLSELELYTILENKPAFDSRKTHSQKSHSQKYTLVGKKYSICKLKALYYKIIPKVTENNYSNKKEKKLKTKAKKH